MSYLLQWTNPALPGKAAITVNVATALTTAAPITLTGKGAANYGQIQQQNIMHVLENFASNTSPVNPTLGMNWYDSANNVLTVCTSISPIVWETLSGVQVTNIGTAPVNPSIGDLWFERGTHSGYLYTYTGTGRYPPSPWDAHASGYYPAVSTLTAPFLNIKLNFSAFATPNFNEAYIHGFTGATPTDTDGQIRVAGVLATVPRGSLNTFFPGRFLLLWDTTSTLVGPGSAHFFDVRVDQLGHWEYDNNLTWVPFVPVTGMYFIGFVNVAETDDQTAPGITYGEVWQDAVPVAQYFHVTDLTAGTGAAGGWHQIWPAVEQHGARFEYDALMANVQTLLGSPFTSGGNEALRGLPLTDFQLLDAGARLAAYGGFPPTPAQIAARDVNYGPTNTYASLGMEPASQDWDLLLAAARWGVNRLDLPASMVSGISTVPFTQDGRVASPILANLPANDINHPTTDRLTFRRWGSITGVRLYSETMNVLQAALAQRYSLKGIAGQNSTILTLDPNIATYTHAVHSAAYTGSTATTSILQFHFENTETLGQFVNSGAAVDLKLNYALPGSPSANDLTFQAFINTFNTLRITADRVRAFGNSLPLTLSAAPTNAGFQQAGISPSYVNIATFTSGGSSIIVALSYLTNGQSGQTTMGVRISITGPSGLGGTTTLTHNVLRDTQTFGADLSFFPRPITYVTGADTAGTDAVWTDVAIAPPPTVNFSVNTTSGTHPLAVNFTYTGTGSPTLVEWDFTGDGTYDATGTTSGTTYTSAGTYTVRCRATNAGGQDILTRSTYIAVA